MSLLKLQSDSQTTVTLTSSHKADSHLSLESVCSSGYDSAQPDSRTATPTDLQAHIPEFFDDNFIPTPGHHDFPPLQLRQPDAAHKLHDKVSLSCSDSHSLCSGSTTYSLHSTATVNDTQLSTVFTPIHKCDSRDALSESRTEDHDISLNNSIASVVIHTLKHRSDGWTGPRVKSKPIDPIISRLRRGREEAIKRQEVIETFLCEASFQLEIQKEASDAKLMCAGSEYVEAERLILIAGERYAAYMTEAQQMVSEFGQSVALDCELEEETHGDHDTPCSATIYLSDIKLNPCDDFVRKLRVSTSTHYFLCVIKEARTKGITATHIGSTSSTSFPDSTIRIEFNNCFTLPWMPCDFELDLEVYHLAVDGVAQPLKRKFINVFNCLAQKSPTVVNKCIPRRCSLGSCIPLTKDARGPRKKEREEPLKSKFEIIGNFKISRSSLKQRVFSLHHHSISSVVCSLQASVQVEPDIVLVTDDIPLDGYLSVFGGHQWERRWFVLTSHSLSYWLCPGQPEQPEPPILTWRLSECCTLPKLADPDSCAWDHAFVLPLQTDHANKLLLAAETEAQLNQWMSALKSLIISLNTWKQ